MVGLVERFPKWYVTTSLQKHSQKIGSLEMDFCQTKDLVVGPLGSGHQPNNTTWKFIPFDFNTFICSLVHSVCEG